jgi:hypothetical protein
VHRWFPSLEAAIEGYKQESESEPEGGSEADLKLVHDPTT